ncbi:ABC transporter permease [Arcobacter sp. LA11]|uniref:ABC transporter permease n=1 Tax=Arcobacter sp. LA11 TaxID=1898176 RepID=UPI00093313F5|nr:ABC transporter permease [Arcobacter sp. LA11]
MNFVENVGNRVISYSLATYDFLVFFFKVIGNMFLPSNYGKSSRIFLVKQVYLSSIENLFSFIFLALFLGSIIIVIAISFALNFNLIDQIGDLLVLLVINEFSPFFTTLFFMFVYSLSLAEKIQNIKKERNSLINKVYIPTLINGLFIVPLMALFFASIMLASGYIVSYLYLNIDFFTYKNLIINSIAFENIIVLLIKGSIFGFVTVLIPLYSGHKKKSNYNLTQVVIKNLIIILSMLIFVELLSILILY